MINKKNKATEWINIRVSPAVRYSLMELKGKMKMVTYDEVLRVLIMDKLSTKKEVTNYARFDAN